MPALGKSLAGCGYQLTDTIAIYCINSAFFCSGGLQDRTGRTTVDEGRLAVGTRSLHSWIEASPARCKVLVMHHPLNWLNEWAQTELRTLLYNDFALCLSGHAHNQKVYHSIAKNRSLVELSAPPLFTTKTDTLGYSIVMLDSASGHAEEIVYRQWTKHQTFVPGVSFTGNESGKICIAVQGVGSLKQVSTLPDLVDEYLTNELNEALKSFSGQPRVWVEPVISAASERAPDASSAKQVQVNELITEPTSTVIQAPPQFGLSCLARFLAQQAWRSTARERWVYLDTRELKSATNNIQKAILSELKRTGHTPDDVKCVILDAWRADDRNAQRILRTVCDALPKTPVFVMQTIDSQSRLSPLEDEKINRQFRLLHLWSLSREHIREVVVSYNKERHVGDEDAVTTRIINDIDTLNIHRTPLNCLTVLKASEVDFDESPVNRTEILHRVLFILFNVDAIPTYKTKPDMKDCEYVMGYYAEKLLSTDTYTFTRDHFHSTLEAFCQDRLMAVDVRALFDILCAAHIIIPCGSNYCFKFTYWLYYFAAQRMHHNREFADYVLTDLRYARFPEIIEFYTGIDRRRDDAVKVLAEDLYRGCNAVHRKCGLPERLNPYPTLEWQPSNEALGRMHEELCDGVAASNLPDAIKDRYADRAYDRRRPYDQAVREILADDTMHSVMLSVSAAARALRNSDFVDPACRRELLIAILHGWKQISKVLWVLLPLLAEKGNATFDGAGFVLAGDFGNTPNERFHKILIEVPYNVVIWYQDDLFSPKMAPLLLGHVKAEEDDVVKHEIMLLLIAKRPKGWKEEVQHYIGSLHKNSFYLYDVGAKLRWAYTYSFTTTSDLTDLEYLIKMVATKHIHGIKQPGPKAISKVPDSVLPKRDAD